VKLIGVAEDFEHLYMALEFVSGGDLFNYLRTVGKLPIEQVRFYGGIVVLIFEYLHSRNIIYRDLKPENLLIDAKGYLKLADFGFAKVVKERTYTQCGTPEYLAPEIILNEGHGKPVDWWTFGILLYEMITGVTPFAGDNNLIIYKKILEGVIKFPTPFNEYDKIK
jgi:protein kinase A